MQITSDLHLHSKYSRAVSQMMTLPVMADYAKKKGLDLLTASDWTHPMWFKEIQNLLEEREEGIYTLKIDTAEKPTRFLLSTEISSIYKQGEKLRRIHNLVFVPDFQTAERTTKALLSRGANLSADGRPIVGLSSKNLLELILDINDRSMLIPCHVWTPHFGIYGSASGFDSLDEAFGDMTKYIYAVETGLSSDPEMNWQIKELRNRSIVSFSDAHSPAKMGREATVFELSEMTYENVRQAIMHPSLSSDFSSQLSATSQTVSQETGKLKTGRPTPEYREPKPDNRIIYTIEFYPEEGKYHFSGHRNCNVSYGPDEIAKNGTNCPVCRKRMTEGVMLRVQTLAGDEYKARAVAKQNDYGLIWHTDKEHIHPSYVKLVPLLEIIAESSHSTVMSQKVKDAFNRLCGELGSELDILLKVPVVTIQKTAGEAIAEGIARVRAGNLTIIPGYDGEYGVVRLWQEGEEPKKKSGNGSEDTSQLSLL